MIRRYSRGRIPTSGWEPAEGGAQMIPRHQWTHDGGEVLILKCMSSAGVTYGGFRWPLEVGAVVEAPDWDAVPKCGSGLHGCVVLGWWNSEANRVESRCAEVGCGDGSDGKLKAHTWYVVDRSGVIVEAS